MKTPTTPTNILVAIRRVRAIVIVALAVWAGQETLANVSMVIHAPWLQWAVSIGLAVTAVIIHQTRSAHKKETDLQLNNLAQQLEQLQQDIFDLEEEVHRPRREIEAYENHTTRDVAGAFYEELTKRAQGQ